MRFPRQDEFFRLTDGPDGDLIVELPDIADVRAGQELTVNERDYRVMEMRVDFGPVEWAPKWWVNQVQRLTLRPMDRALK